MATDVGREGINAAFARSLWQLRIADGLSQRQLAAKSGVPESTIKHGEAPRLDRPGGCLLATAIPLAAALGTTVDAMVAVKDERKVT